MKSWCLSARRLVLAISSRSFGVFCSSQVQQIAASRSGSFASSARAPHGERRAMVDHEEPDDQSGAAIGTPAVLAQHDLGPKPTRDEASLAPLKWPLASHGRPPQIEVAGLAAPFGLHDSFAASNGS